MLLFLHMLQLHVKSKFIKVDTNFCKCKERIHVAVCHDKYLEENIFSFFSSLVTVLS